jgi:hypothetical protein
MQFVLAAAYVSAIGIALGRAASFSGRLYLPSQGDEYTGNADIWLGFLGKHSRPLHEVAVGGLV